MNSDFLGIARHAREMGIDIFGNEGGSSVQHQHGPHGVKKLRKRKKVERQNRKKNRRRKR